MTTESRADIAASRQELEAWRQKIDAIDQQLSTLLGERLLCAENIIALKSQIGEQVLQPEREKVVLSNVLERAASPLHAGTLEKIYRCIIEETRLFQHECKGLQEKAR